MIDRAHELPLTRQAAAAEAQPEQRLLPAPAGVAGRSGDHAADRRAASGLPVRGQPDAARSAARRGRRDRPPARVATMMKRMGIEALYRRPNTSKPAPGHKIYPYLLRGWRSSGRTRCGRWTSPTSRWRAASSIWPPWSTGSAAGFWPGGCRSRWRSSSASRRSRRRSPSTAGRRFSTPTRAANSPAPRSPACC